MRRWIRWSIGDDGSIDVVTTQVLRADRLPGIVAQFHRGDLSIQREEKWSPVRDGRADATVNGTIPGAPVTCRAPRCWPRQESGTGSRLDFKAAVEVRVPLVGGKIETFVGSLLVDLLIAEQRFTTVWITENA